MLDLETNTRKAGAYVLCQGYFLFMVGYGIDYKEHELGIVRFGGHREPGESVKECAQREVREETSLDIKFFGNSVTYITRGQAKTYEKTAGGDGYSPILVKVGEDEKYSVLYLAHTAGMLRPNMETQGVLMLKKEDVDRICAAPMTLKEYKETGGRVVLAQPLPEEAVLSPNTELHFLRELFDKEPALMKAYTQI